jgi:DNA-binding PadR family transcriptional regulator
MFRFLVLGLLRGGAARHGYALMKEYRERSGYEMSTGNFYRELQRLVGEGLVQAAHNPPGADPRRAPYEITDDGVAAFDAWLAGPTSLGNGHSEDELSSRTLFLADVDPALARHVLERWKEDLWVRGKTLERAREALLQRRNERGRRPLAALVFLLARRLKHVAADLEFVDELRTALEAGAEESHGRNGVHRPATLPLENPDEGRLR